MHAAFGTVRVTNYLTGTKGWQARDVRQGCGREGEAGEDGGEGVPRRCTEGQRLKS